MNSYDEAKERIPTQHEKIIHLLKVAGEEGVTNSELSKVSLQYSSRISELYMLGYITETIPVKDGVYKYVLIKIVPAFDIKKARDEILMIIQKDYDDRISSYELDQLLDEKYFNIHRRSGWFKQQTIIH